MYKEIKRSYKTIPLIASFLILISVADLYISSSMTRSWILDNTYIHYEKPLSISTLTGAFFHNDFSHLFKNLILICSTIPVISLKYDNKTILGIFVASAVLGSFVFSVTSGLLSLDTFARGSSGASFFFLGVFFVILGERFNMYRQRVAILSLLAVLIFETSKYLLNIEFFSINLAVSVAHLTCMILGIYFDSLKRDQKQKPAFYSR